VQIYPDNLLEQDGGLAGSVNVSGFTLMRCEAGNYY
jgi:hypothetical protein